MNAIPDKRWPDPNPMHRDPEQWEIDARAKSILAHLCRNPNVWHEAASQRIADDQAGDIGQAMRDGDDAEVGRLLRTAGLTKMTEDAADLAERSFYDNFTKWEEDLLKGWKA
ncbi:MAG: hypothetical protein KGO96_14065 [Elusimicrobia bacterium]|nr:hypothetical protein [Elusimicrobiota bacterium]